MIDSRIDARPEVLLGGIGQALLARMHAAGERLAALSANPDPGPLSWVPEAEGGFERWRHYPESDVFDPATHAQYYFHVHGGAPEEYGHFHTFLRAPGMPSGMRPSHPVRGPLRARPRSAAAHLVAVSVDERGRPGHLFTTNRWVTGESFFAAEDAVAMLDRFALSGGEGGPALDRWLEDVLLLFRPQIEMLLHRRDAVIRDRAARSGERDVLEDRSLEIASITAVDMDRQIAAVRAALDAA